MARKPAKTDSQQLVAYIFAICYVAASGVEYYSKYQTRPYSTTGPARAIRARKEKKRQYRLRNDPNADLWSPHHGRLMVAPDGDLSWEGLASNPAYFQGDPNTLEPVTDIRYRIFQLDKNGITEIV